MRRIVLYRNCSYYLTTRYCPIKESMKELLLARHKDGTTIWYQTIIIITPKKKKAP